MKKVKPLAFIDSGVGGIPYLAHLQALLPQAPLVYAADNLNFPYGSKSETEIRSAVLAMARRMIERYDPELVIVACNTASMLVLEDLRQTFDRDFVGVVPAVKPAAERSQARSIGVMATERATKGAYLDHLIEEYAADCRVTRVAATELISTIERDPFMDDQARFQHLLGEIRRTFQAAAVDTIVLGCTHFLLLKPELLAHFGMDFTIVDSRQGVSRRALALLDSHGTLDDYQNLQPGEAGPSIFHLTAELAESAMYQRLAAFHGLEFGGTL